MGRDHTLHDTSHSKCDFTGVIIHLPTEDDQPSREGKKWKRVQAIDRCVDAGQ
jgi:hypothetical protein